MPHTYPVSSDLHSIPVGRRRHAAALLGILAVLMVCVGVVPWTGPTSGAVRVFAVVLLFVAVGVALIAWGLLQSTVIDARAQHEAALDATLLEAAGSAVACSCGHEHDPDELHVTDATEPCGPDSTDCPHTCETCVLHTLRA